MGSKLERDPTLAELAKEVDLPTEKVEEIFRSPRRIRSRSTRRLVTKTTRRWPTSFPTRGRPLGCGRPQASGARRSRTCSVICRSERQRLCGSASGSTTAVLARWKRSAEEFGVTRERIRQIESKTLAKLRHPLAQRTLRDYLD